MRIAVIGAGSIGRRHLATLLALGERQIGLYDTNLSAAAALCTAEMGEAVGCFADMDDVWEWQPTCVLICTPPETHLTLIDMALTAGVTGIFCEKPLALHRPYGPWVNQLDGRVTMVGCQWRWHPVFTAMKQWAQGDTISRPAQFYATIAYDLSIRPDYRTCYAATTGATLDIGSHLVDLAVWCFGAASLKQAMVWPAKRIGLACDGGVDIELNHEGGITSHLTADFDSGRFERSMAIVGTDGEPDIKLLLLNGTNKMYVDELRHFLTCVRENRPTCNPVSAAAETLSLLLEAKTWAR